jgi:hypothetical protein
LQGFNWFGLCNFGRKPTTRVTRWVCEKIAQNVAQCIFWQN